MSPPLLVVMVTPPLALIPDTVSVPEFVRLTLPLLEFVALKLPTVFAPSSVCPPEEDVVSVPEVLRAPAPDSLIAPDAARLIAPAPVVTAPVIASALPVVAFNA